MLVRHVLCLKKTCNICVVDFCCTELNMVVKIASQVWVDRSREFKVGLGMF